MTEIGTRLKQFRIRYQISMPRFPELQVLQKDNLYKWERGAKPSDVLLYNKLTDYLDKNGTGRR